MAAVAHAHWLGVGGQGQLIARAAAAEDVATVATVMLEWERGSHGKPNLLGAPSLNLMRGALLVHCQGCLASGVWAY